MVDYEEAWMVCVARERRRTLQKLVATCPGLERTILELMYGFADGREYTVADISHILGRCRENIRSTHRRALDRIRRTYRRRRLPMLEQFS